MRTVTPGSVAAAAVLAASVVLAACGTGSSSPTTTSATPATPTTGAATSTTTSTVPSAPTTTTPPSTLPLQTPTGGEFQSPTGNISCEIDIAAPSGTSPSGGQAAGSTVYCVTFSPPEHVVMSADGALTRCTGSQCLSNAGLDTPVLAYGTATGAPPFTCVSATTGMTCTITDGRGFQISRAGIFAVG